MRHAEIGIAPLPALAPTQATRPGAPLGGAGFAGVFGQLHQEVAEFISHGTPAGAAMIGLTPEGQLWRARSQLGAPQAGAVSAPEQQAFLARIAPFARVAGERLGVAPELIAAHAALESGWGKRPLRQADGGSSHNLFGIKAGPHWQGEVVPALTTEYEHGTGLKKNENFRSYPDQASAFRDYAQLLLDNPRYAAALGAGGDARAFAEGLARGGYATDPAYAAKLARLAGRLQGVSD